MRKQWFGDSRDYVKWSCIRQEAGEGFTVCYAAMLRPDSFKDSNLDDAVVRFFDTVKDLQVLERLFPKRFEAVSDIYQLKTADDYFTRVIGLLQEMQKRGGNVLVFLDPDTGIEPSSKAKDTHLRVKDLRKVCEALNPSDKIVIYQHALHTSNWRTHFRKKLEGIAGETGTMLRPDFYSPGVAKDVCFFTITRN